jgi:hypothetical protein
MEFGVFLMKIIVFPCKLFSVMQIFGLIGVFFVLVIFKKLSSFVVQNSRKYF